VGRRFQESVDVLVEKLGEVRAEHEKHPSINADQFFLWLWNNGYAEKENLKERLRQFFVKGIDWASQKAIDHASPIGTHDDRNDAV